MKSKILNYDFLYLMHLVYSFSSFSASYFHLTQSCVTPYFLSFLCMVDYLTVVLKCCSAGLLGNDGVIPSEVALIH
jgi:hypothetical protein